jgi:hypothetical protein
MSDPLQCPAAAAHFHDGSAMAKTQPQPGPLSTLAYWKLCFDVLRPRRRLKYTPTFRCDCGWRTRRSVLEQADLTHVQTVVCNECGDAYRLLGGAVIRVIPNPLHRCLISDRASCIDGGAAAMTERYRRALDALRRESRAAT